jgi:hypothetical protein
MMCLDEKTQDATVLLLHEMEKFRNEHPINRHLAELLYVRMRDAAGVELRKNNNRIIKDRVIEAGGEHWIAAAAACMRIYLEGATHVSPSQVRFFACMARPLVGNGDNINA